jgi:hypothetical protein
MGLRFELRIEKCDRPHDAHGVVSIVKDDPDEGENKRRVDQRERLVVRLVTGICPADFGRRKRRTERVYDALDKIEHDEHSPSIPHARALDHGSQPDLKHATENLSTSSTVFGIGGGSSDSCGIWRRRPDRTTNDVHNGRRHSPVSHLEHLWFRSHRNVR